MTSATSGRNSRSTGTSNHSGAFRSEEHTSELQSRENLVCRLLLEKKKAQFRDMLSRSSRRICCDSFFVALHVPSTTSIYTLSLHDALPILHRVSSTSITSTG